MTIPWSATFSMLTLRSLAMKPITEKMTKPAKMLVALLVQVTMSVSLGGGDESLPLGVLCKSEGTRGKTCKCVPVCLYARVCVCVYMSISKHVFTVLTEGPLGSIF